MITLRIGLIGDYSATVPAHQAIPMALTLAGNELGCAVELVWLATPTLAGSLETQLKVFAALWCVPASPYASMDGALQAIRYAREHAIPFLGTCGGSQHAMIEYARNVLNYAAADHAESNSEATLPLIAPLSCAMLGTTGSVTLEPGSRMHRIYGRSEIVESYFCRFGLNPSYEHLFTDGKFRVTGRDAYREVRAMELDGHVFYLITLFQPELAALSGVTPPLVRRFVQVALRCTARVQV